MRRSQRLETTYSGPREVFIGLGIYFFYLLIRKAVVNEKGERKALKNAEIVVRAEQEIGIHIEPAIQRAMLPYPRILHIMSLAYAALNVGLTVGWLIHMFRRRHPEFHWLRNAAVYAVLGAFPFFRFFPCAPPRKLEHMVDTIADVSGIDLEHESISRFYIPIAAMPSIHVTFAVVTGLGMAQTSSRSWVRVLGKLYTPFVAFVVFATGNHYILDGVLGAFIGAVSLRVARLRRLRSL